MISHHVITTAHIQAKRKDRFLETALRHHISNYQLADKTLKRRLGT